MDMAETPAWQRDEVTGWIDGGVKVEDYFAPFPPRERDIQRLPAQIQTAVRDADASGHPPRTWLKNPPLGADDTPFGSKRAFVDAEIRRLLQSGAIARVDEQPWLVMPLVVAVGSKKLRLVFDCRLLNLFCVKRELKYPSVGDFARGVERDDYMSSIDAKSGYHSVRLAHSSRKYMGFEYDGRFYVFLVLPFGWSLAPFVYQTLTDIRTGAARALGVHDIGYLDDDAIAELQRWLADFKSSAVAATLRDKGRCVLDDSDFDSVVQRRQYRAASASWIVTAIAYLAGFTLNRDKARLVPSRQLLFLGIVVDSEARCFAIPDDKMARAVQDTDALLAADWTNKLSLQRYCGRMNFLAVAAPVIHAYLRPLWDLMGGDEVSAVDLVPLADPAVRAALTALRGIKLWDRVFPWSAERHAPLVIHTDASGSGMGGELIRDDGSPLLWQAPVPAELVGSPIHILEGLAVVLMLQRCGAELRGRFVDLYVDNESVRLAILHWRARDAALNDVITAICDLQLAYRIHLQVRRVPTEENVVADRLSRTTSGEFDVIEHGDHMLAERYFAKVASWAKRHFHGDFSVDLCANERNRQCRRFYSLRFSRADGFLGLNALAHDCGVSKSGERELVYVNPPWALLGAIWRHLRQCRARGVLLFPLVPSYPWFGDVVGRCLEVAVVAPAGANDVFLQPSRGYAASVGPVPWAVAAGRFDFS
jgi:hypothetical protein